MHDDVAAILNRHNIMAIATLRPDGWPQNTTVSYVNEGVLLYFLISRTSQKFANLTRDGRVSIAIASEPAAPSAIQGLSIAAETFEVRDQPYLARMLSALSTRRPGYFDPATLDMAKSALMRATPTVISIVDFSKGLGHAETVTIGGEELIEFTAVRPDNWGPNPAP